MLSYQSPMPAGAGTPRYENVPWSLEVFGCGWCRPSPLDSRFRENDEVGWWPAGAGLPRPGRGRFVNRPYSDVGGWWDASGHHWSGAATAADKPQPYILRCVSNRMPAIRRAVSAKCWTSSGLRGRRRMVRSR